MEVYSCVSMDIWMNSALLLLQIAVIKNKQGLEFLELVSEMPPNNQVLPFFKYMATIQQNE